MNKHLQFWLTIGSLFSLVGLLIFMLWCGFKEQFIFRKEYCLFFMPTLLYLMFQMVVNYANLTEDGNK